MTTQVTNPATANTGLQSKALTVNLNICQWSARKHDKKITKEVADTHNAKDDAGRYNKLLVAKKDLEEIQKIASAARIFHYENTLPWGDNGDRILPSANYFAYTQEIAQYKAKFEKAVIDFIANYDAVIEDAKIRLNGMFDPQDYPNKVEMQTKFRVNVCFMPLPEVDFRLDISATEINSLKLEVENAYRERTAAAMSNIWQRIGEALNKMKERLTATTEDNSPAVFRNSLFDNVADLITLLPKLNVTNSPDVDKICEDMKVLLVNPDAVRTNSNLRNQKAQEVNQILNNFSDFFA